MTSRTLMIAALALAFAGGAFLMSPSDARGDAKSELAKVVQAGEKLWKKQWAPGQKSCAKCHDRGPNKMIGARLNKWPKYDKFLKKVATAQEKLNHMIVKQSKGKALELGSDELTALEAYIKSR